VKFNKHVRAIAYLVIGLVLLAMGCTTFIEWIDLTHEQREFLGADVLTFLAPFIAGLLAVFVSWSVWFRSDGGKQSNESVRLNNPED